MTEISTRTVDNCTNCPMARDKNYKYTILYSCNISDEIMTVFKDSDIDDDELPLPLRCPLRQTSINITHTTNGNETSLESPV